MHKQYRKLLVLPLCLAMAFTLMTTSVSAYEEQTELPTKQESVDPMEEPSEVHDDTPLDGNWCFDEENHWRADAVNQGIPTPHVDDDKDGICDVCQWVLSEPIENPSVSNEEEELTVSPVRDLSETSPKTGDESDFALWTVMLLLSASALTTVILTLRKCSKQ